MESSSNENKSQEPYISNEDTLANLKEIKRQNQVSMFYLFKFADLYSHNHHNNSGVCFGSFHHSIIVFYIRHIKC